MISRYYTWYRFREKARKRLLKCKNKLLIKENKFLCSSRYIECTFDNGVYDFFGVEMERSGKILRYKSLIGRTQR
jgi:hypothetical protein